MAGIDKKLTDLTELSNPTDNAWIHVVEPSDISQNAAGSSYKSKKGNINPDATVVSKGKVKLAGDFDLSSTADLPRIKDATTSVKGKIKLAGDFDPTSTADNPVIKQATEVQSGKVELATDIETIAGADATKAVHPFGLKGALDLKANDDNTLHKTGNETFTGTKSYTVIANSAPALSVTNSFGGGGGSHGISISNTNNGTGLNIATSGSGFGISIQSTGSSEGILLTQAGLNAGLDIRNNGVGTGIRLDNTANGVGTKITNSSTGVGFIINNTTASTGKPFQYTKNSVEKAFLNDAGIFMSQSVLINTTTDNGVDKLQVNGPAIATAWKTTGGTSAQTVMGDGSLKSVGEITKTRKDITGTSYTLLSSDVDKILYTTNASPVTITVPSGLTTNQEYDVIQYGDGLVSYITSGTTLRYQDYEIASHYAKYSRITITYIDTETYQLLGQLKMI